MAEFSLPQQRFPGPVEVPAPNVNSFTAGSAHTSVLPVVDPSWANMLPRGPNMGDMISAAELQAKLQQTQRQDKGRNMLAQLYGNPQNVGPDGSLKPEAMRMLAAAGYPDQMLSVMGTQAEIAQRQQQTRASSSKFMSDEQTRLMTDFEPLVAEYDRNVKEVGQPRAREVFQQRYTEEVSKAKTSGLYSPATVARINPTGDPERLRANILGLKGVQDSQLRQSQESRAVAGEGRAAIASARGSEDKPENYEYIDQAGNRRTGLVTYNRDNKTFYDSENRPVKQAIRAIGTENRTNAERFIGVGSDGKQTLYHYGLDGQPVDDKGEAVDTSRFRSVRKIGARDQTAQEQLLEQYKAENPGASAEDLANYLQRMKAPRSALGMTVGAFIKENPNASAADIASFTAWTRARGATEQAFAAGVEGRTTRSLDVAMDHLTSLGELVDALNNGSVNTINAVANRLKTEFNLDTAPVTIEAARSIIGTEIVKAVAGGANALADREEARAPLDPKLGPKELHAVIAEDKRLMAGQLRGLEQQYLSAVVPPNKRGDKDAEEQARRAYRYKLFPETLTELERAATPVAGGKTAGGSTRTEPAAGPDLRPPIANPDAPAAQPGAPAPAVAPSSSEAPPVEMLKEGKETTFKTGGTWTLRDGKPVKVRD
jgi:hypothetical protein